ncbi:MAG: tyrosine-type recombinase/integrase, partial [Candidatus Onthovivens sp.]|nr:tyrosine-type recombinase/integrase [Candidatus Onthovivens sp.]
KTKSSKDFVMIDKFLYKKLLKLKKEESKKEYFSDDSFVFNNNNKPFSHTTIERHKNFYCKKARVNQIQLKEFRHSHATNIFYISHDIELVKKRLRHSSSRITLDTYTHFLDKNKREQKALFHLRFF